MDIIVDAYGSEEQAMGWYYYLEEKLQFPFTAVCNAKRVISPLRVQDEVDVIGMAARKAANSRTDNFARNSLDRIEVARRGSREESYFCL